MNKKLQVFGVLVIIFLLVLIRGFATELFYDPFIKFFKNDYLSASFPMYDTVKININLLFRYTLNSLLSLGILYLIFQSKQQLFFAVKFYVLAFFVLLLIYNFQLNNQFSQGYLVAFYVRRLLIHPIFLLLLIPAFYYQKRA